MSDTMSGAIVEYVKILGQPAPRAHIVEAVTLAGDDIMSTRYLTYCGWALGIDRVTGFDELNGERVCKICKRLGAA